MIKRYSSDILYFKESNGYKISFWTAVHVFDDPDYIEMYDFEHSEDEERFIAIGRVGDTLLMEVEEAKKHPIVFDKDCEELSPAMINLGHRALT